MFYAKVIFTGSLITQQNEQKGRRTACMQFFAIFSRIL